MKVGMWIDGNMEIMHVILFFLSDKIVVDMAIATLKNGLFLCAKLDDAITKKVYKLGSCNLACG